MNALASLYVNQHLQDLLDEAAQERLRRSVQPARPSRIASAMSALRGTFGRREPLPA